MLRTILAVIGLAVIVILGGVIYAGYSVYQTTEHAVAAVKSIQTHLPNVHRPKGQGPAGTRPVNQRPPWVRSTAAKPVATPATRWHPNNRTWRNGTQRPYTYPNRHYRNGTHRPYTHPNQYYRNGPRGPRAR